MYVVGLGFGLLAYQVGVEEAAVFVNGLSAQPEPCPLAPIGVGHGASAIGLPVHPFALVFTAIRIMAHPVAVDLPVVKLAGVYGFTWENIYPVAVEAIAGNTAFLFAFIDAFPAVPRREFFRSLLAHKTPFLEPASLQAPQAQCFCSLAMGQAIGPLPFVAAAVRPVTNSNAIAFSFFELADITGAAGKSVSALPIGAIPFEALGMEGTGKE